MKNKTTKKAMRATGTPKVTRNDNPTASETRERAKRIRQRLQRFCGDAGFVVVPRKK